MHGSELNRKQWLPQLAALQDEFRLLAPDLPGHGALRGERFSLDRALDCLAYLIESEASGRAVVVGLSLGGYVAMAFARAHASRLTGLVLSGCSWRLRGPVTWAYRAYCRLCRHGGPSLIEGLRSAELRLLQRGPTSDAIVQHGLSGHVTPDIRAELEGCDPFAWLEGFGGAALLLNGSLDPAFRQDESALRALLPQAGVRIIPGARHLANLDRPRDFSEAVRGFVQGLTG